MRRVLIVLAGCLAACQDFPDPPVTYLSGLRVLGIQAEPPEVPPDGGTTMTMLVVDTQGRTPVASWSRCTLPPLVGEVVNSDCVANLTAPYLEPIGDGVSIATTMPPVTAEALGQPDSTGGVYLPLVARVTAGASALAATYRLRLGGAVAPANTNPTIAQVTWIDATGATVALDEASPPIVHANDRLSLGVTAADGSAETYVDASGDAVAEVLKTSWFATAGEFDVERTSDTQPRTVLYLDRRLPAAGTVIDVYAVTRDERGGMAYVHRAFMLE